MASDLLPTVMMVSGALIMMLAAGLDVDWRDENKNGVGNSHAASQKHELPVDPKLLCRRKNAAVLRRIDGRFNKLAAEKGIVLTGRENCPDSLPARAPAP